MLPASPHLAPTALAPPRPCACCPAPARPRAVLSSHADHQMRRASAPSPSPTRLLAPPLASSPPRAHASSAATRLRAAPLGSTTALARANHADRARLALALALQVVGDGAVGKVPTPPLAPPDRCRVLTRRSHCPDLPPHLVHHQQVSERIRPDRLRQLCALPAILLGLLACPMRAAHTLRLRADRACPHSLCGCAHGRCDGHRQ